ncbi:MAG: hypothetical protein WAN50_04085 [Minisyncoccia bacterium]
MAEPFDSLAHGMQMPCFSAQRIASLAVVPGERIGRESLSGLLQAFAIR